MNGSDAERSTPATGVREALRACWRQPAARLGLLLCLLHFAFMAFLTIYHTALGTQVPDNATPAEVWGVLPPWEQKSVIASGVVFAVGIVIAGIGLARALRGVPGQNAVR